MELEILKTFTRELKEFEIRHGEMNVGFATGLFSKLAEEYAEAKAKEAFEAGRKIDAKDDKSWYAYPDYVTYKSLNNLILNKQ